jgi:lipopolysaccharide export system protein LptA
MNPGGKSIHEIRSPTQSQLEFRPNSADQLHRTVESSSLRAVYGEGSYIQSLEGEKAVTHTDRPHPAKGNTPASISKATTSSDHLMATFEPSSNKVHFIRQNGHFQYSEGKRRASADNAVIEEETNRITLEGKANVADETGSTSANKIVMNQVSGDMDALQRVISVRTPDANQKPGGSMLDPTRVLQAKADQMNSREDNTDIFYTGHAVIWQGGNRITADRIEINRDESTIRANGNVVSDLIDNKPAADPNAAPVLTVVRAPKLLYHDDLRLADYTGGVQLTRLKMVVTGKELKAYLTPKSPTGGDDSSLDHAFADGDVVVTSVVSTGTRKGIGEHGEYYAKTGKVILNGGHPEVDDTRKGTTKGRQITYFSDDDKLIVEGEKNQLAFTRMKK